MDTSTANLTAAALLLSELRDRGHTLPLKTRPVAQEYEGNVVHQTRAGALRITGGEALTEELQTAVREHATYLKAAVAVSNPPVDWIAEAARRYVVGVGTPTKRGGKPVVLKVTLDSLASTIAAFLGAPQKEFVSVYAAVQDELGRPELRRALQEQKARTITVEKDDKPPQCPKEPYRDRQRQLKDDEKAGREYERLVEERYQKWLAGRQQADQQPQQGHQEGGPNACG